MLTIFVAVASLAIILWCAGAIYFDVVGESAAGLWAAAAWIVCWIVLFVAWRPPWQPFMLLLGALGVILCWWLSQRPSQDRDWNPHFDCVAGIAADGDLLTVRNVRNSEYGDHGHSAARFETRTLRLSQLRAVDALILTWGSRWMSHPMFVFDFGSDGRLCISIEVRYRRGQRFSFVRSLFRQQELIYVVSDERDAILRRTKWLSGHDLYLYRLNVDKHLVRQFFADYMSRINELAAEPCWYHGLTTNCTTSVYAQSRELLRWHWRMLVNGALDRLLYDRRLIDQSLPFERLKQLSWINDVANRAPEAGFGDFIRAELPNFGRSGVASTPLLGEGD